MPLGYITPPNKFYKTMWMVILPVYINLVSMEARRGHCADFTLLWNGCRKSNPKSSERKASAPNCWAISLSPSLSFEIGSCLLCYPDCPQTLSSCTILFHALVMRVCTTTSDSTYFIPYNFLTFWKGQNQQKSMPTLLLANEVQKAHVNSNIPQESGMVPVVTQKKFRQSHWDLWLVCTAHQTKLRCVGIEPVMVVYTISHRTQEAEAGVSPCELQDSQYYTDLRSKN